MNGLVQTFDSETAYRNAIAATLALARKEVRIFDRSLMAMGLEDASRIDLLTAFLAQDRYRRVRLVVHDADPMQRFAPRLLALLRRFSHAVEVRRTPERLRHLTDCWVLADAVHGTVRFHADHPRGKQVWNDGGEIGPWWQRAEELWNECEICSPASVTGL